MPVPVPVPMTVRLPVSLPGRTPLLLPCCQHRPLKPLKKPTQPMNPAHPATPKRRRSLQKQRQFSRSKGSAKSRRLAGSFLPKARTTDRTPLVGPRPQPFLPLPNCQRKRRCLPLCPCPWLQRQMPMALLQLLMNTRTPWWAPRWGLS